MSYRKDQYFSRTIIRCRVEITSLYRCICPLSSTKPKPTNSKSRRLHKTHIFCESPPTQGMMMSYRRGQKISRTKFVFRVEITSLYRYIYRGSSTKQKSKKFENSKTTRNAYLLRFTTDAGDDDVASKRSN